MATCLVSLPTQLITLQDIIVDSPVWRANAILLEDQIDQYEKWLDGFIRALKSYIEAMSTANLCKRTFLSGVDGALMDTIVNNFAETMQSTLTSKIQMVTELEENLLNPLQKLYKQDLKIYKDNRKQFEKILDKYETQLNRYFALSKQKEASALREDAFQMHELRKLYVKQSGDHFIKLISFKSQIEHLLVECFSNTMNAHIEDIEESKRSFASIKSKLPGWIHWLDESKMTCDHQIDIMTERYSDLTEIYIQKSTPHRSLKRYSISQEDNSPAAEEIEIKEKHGYLNCRIGKSSWVRRWFFLQKGWFGTLTAQRQRGYILMNDRVSISECTFKIVDGDRRFCFEITHRKSSFLLQTETEEDMQEWIQVLETLSKNPEEIQKEHSELEPLLYPKSLMLSTKDNSLTSSCSSDNLIPATSTTISLLTTVMLDNSQTTSESPPTKASNNISSGSLLSWGMPWINATEEEPVDQQTDTCLVWPSKLEEINKPDLEHYMLETRHKELRKLFGHVPKEEVVLDAFKASYYGQKDQGPQFGYSGILYLTQKSLWFYSCTLMTHLQLCMIPLEKLETIKIENTVNGTWLLLNNMLFGLWCCTSAETVVERLKTTSSKKIPDMQTLYDTLRSMSTTKMRNHLSTSSALYPSVTPLTIQIQQPSPMMKQNSSTSTSNSAEHDESVDSSDSAAHVALKAAYQSTQSKSLSKLKISTRADDYDEDDGSKEMPSEEQKCECKDHLDKNEADVVFDMSAKRLFGLLFSQSDIWTQLNKVKECGEPTVTDWVDQEDGKERTLTYMIPVFNPMVKAKETQVVETQQILSEKERLTYVVLVTTKTPNLPYADTFLPSIKYCITYISPNKSRLSCSIGIQWVKSVNIFVKKMIKNEAMKGMTETVSTLVQILQQQQTPTRRREKKKTTMTTVQENVGKEKKPNKMRIVNILLIFVFFFLTFYQFKIQHKYKQIVNHPIHWKGVYLQDLENLTQHQVVLGDQVNPKIYELFQQDRMNLIDWKYTWRDRQHKSIAFELGYSRERIGTLRYKVLSILRVLNHLEGQPQLRKTSM
ncbi:unnamed protein product [Rhizopus stolonifer]